MENKTDSFERLMRDLNDGTKDIFLQPTTAAILDEARSNADYNLTRDDIELFRHRLVTQKTDNAVVRATDIGMIVGMGGNFTDDIRVWSGQITFFLFVCFDSLYNISRSIEKKQLSGKPRHQSTKKWLAYAPGLYVYQFGFGNFFFFSVFFSVFFFRFFSGFFFRFGFGSIFFFPLSYRKFNRD